MVCAFVGSVSPTIYSGIHSGNVPVPGTEPGAAESMTHGTDATPVLMKLTLTIFVEVEGMYCEQELTVG